MTHIIIETVIVPLTGDLDGMFLFHLVTDGIDQDGTMDTIITGSDTVAVGITILGIITHGTMTAIGVLHHTSIVEM